MTISKIKPLKEMTSRKSNTHFVKREVDNKPEN